MSPHFCSDGLVWDGFRGNLIWKSKLDTMVFAIKYDVPVHLPGNQSNEEWDCTFISFVWLTWQTRQQFNIYLTNHPPCKINHLGVSNKYPNIPTMGFLVGFSHLKSTNLLQESMMPFRWPSHLVQLVSELYRLQSVVHMVKPPVKHPQLNQKWIIYIYIYIMYKII